MGIKECLNVIKDRNYCKKRGKTEKMPTVMALKTVLYIAHSRCHKKQGQEICMDKNRLTFYH